MKILVLSDSHGELRYMEKAVFDETPDHILHLGDKLNDARALRERFPRIPMTAVPGNCDLGAIDPPVLVQELGGVRFLITHGHVHGVKMGLMRLSYAAMEAGAQVAVYGHTHIAAHREECGVHLLNPGAAGGGCPSYGVIELENGRVSCRIIRL